MTPKEKAEELVIGFLKVELPSDGFMLFNIAKQCALIAVDEIICAIMDYGADTYELQNMDRVLDYYDKVKTEIENL